MSSFGVAKGDNKDGAAPEMMLRKQDFEKAIGEEQLSLVFQPKVRLADGRGEGFEALTRWSHPEHGYISPEVFVQIAEACELIHPFTKWVMRRSFSQLRYWCHAGLRTSLSINVSVRNFASPHFVDDMRAMLDEFEIHPASIELEITESALIQDSAIVCKRLLMLRDLGVKLSIDDFGAGYASLAYLKMLPVDVLKIDRSFIAALDSNKADQRIVAWTIRLAHDFGMQVVAEGVETKQVMDLLREMGCDMAQGYFIGRPMRADDAHAWWAANASSQASIDAPCLTLR
ncbi:EAL domain-containing protein [Ralstonia sp. ASV6]|uniref:EAL domain-containing protein n=1 Tax=Ralstonia sp. ASV6 TaxID=2795124 RepID=UPI0018EDDF1A|nr:EAL domain-containing protein [Ralstonia sp. ASV6]